MKTRLFVTSQLLFIAARSGRGVMDFILGSKFEFEAARQWASQMEWTVLHISLTYVATIFAIKFAMRDRKPYELQQPLVLWNALLAVFSILGVARLTPAFFNHIAIKGYVSESFPKLALNSMQMIHASEHIKQFGSNLL